MQNTLFYIEGKNSRYEEFLIQCNKREIQDILAEQGRVLREISAEELRAIHKVVSGEGRFPLEESEIHRILRTYSDEELLYLSSIEIQSTDSNRYSISPIYTELSAPICMPAKGAPKKESIKEEPCEESKSSSICYDYAPSPSGFPDPTATPDPLQEALHLIQLLEREQKLSQLGALLGENTLTQLRRQHTPEAIKIRIDSHWRILSEDADIEVKMPTLSKVLYFLFLRHPEGIVLKQISDYKEELLRIYLLFSPARTMADIARSIDALTDGLDGSINQKISRVNAAFQGTLAYSSDWQISGKRGNIKKVEGAAQITLPERLKTLE